MTDVTSPPRSLPTIGDFVRVHNTSEVPFTLQYNSRKYLVAPGVDTVVPFEAAILYFGDPRSGMNIATIVDEVGNRAWIPDRATEVRRLRCLYDNQTGPEDVIRNAPPGQVTDLDGNVIPMVVDDVTGDNVNLAAPTVSQQDQLMEVIKRQQQQIDFLTEQYSKGAAATELATHVTPDVTVPDPAATPTTDTTTPTTDTTTELPVDDASVVAPAPIDPFNAS